MTDLKVGDIVVLTAGSMRMAVEAIDGDKVQTVWCNEGVIGRDTFAPILLKKWEPREDDRGGKFNKGPGDRGGFNKGGDRGGFNKGGDKPRDDRPMGRDGKPRDKKFFRKD
jgi:hypothetical protein